MAQQVGQGIGVGMDLEAVRPVPRDGERRTEGVELPAEEVGRAQHAALHALVPVLEDFPFVDVTVGGDVPGLGQVGQDAGLRDVPSLLEEGIAQGEADPLAGPPVTAVGGVGQRQGGEAWWSGTGRGRSGRSIRAPPGPAARRRGVPW